MEVFLHPLAVMNIADHHTRVKVMSGGEGEARNVRVIGGLVGKQRGRTVEVHTSYELVYTSLEGFVLMDLNYLQQKCTQRKRTMSVVLQFSDFFVCKFRKYFLILICLWDGI